MARKRIKVTERKLGRSGALGLYYSDGRMEIDPRQDSREYLDTLIHEALHARFPWMTEEEVIVSANVISDIVWKQNFRRIKE